MSKSLRLACAIILSAAFFTGGYFTAQNKLGTPRTIIHISLIQWKAGVADADKQKVFDGVKEMAAKIPGIKIQDTRMMRLMELLLHGGSPLGGWRTVQIHEAIRTAFALSTDVYTLTQLRYDLRKMKGHGLLERDGKRYCYRLTDKGKRVAAMFVLFHQRVCGPLANSLFHHRPEKVSKPPAKIEAAYHKADDAIQNLIDLLAA